MADALAWAAALAVLGACIGSFVAALAVRWPAGESVATGRSRCDACHATIAARDLVPIFSAWRLGGRCRACQRAILPIHARVEWAGAWVGASAGLAAGGPQALAGATFGWLLVALAALDLLAWWLPDRLTLPLAVFGLAFGQGSLADRAIGGTAGLVGLWLVGRGYRLWRGREGLGGGDPKLLGAIGCWLGWAMLPGVLLLASLIGLAVVLRQRLAGRAVAGDTAVPFGALLAAAAYPAWLAMLAFRT